MAEKWADRADLHTHTTASDGTLRGSGERQLSG